MRHRRRGRKLGRNPNHQRALLRNLASALILTERDAEDDDNKPKVKGRIITTLQKAKEVRPLVERCVTIARRALPHQEAADELEPDAERHSEEWRAWRQQRAAGTEWNQAIAPVVAARRRVLRLLGDKQAVRILFSEIAPRFADRPGGYTRVLRLAKPRLGDAGTRAILEFVGVHDRKRRRAAKPSFEAEPEAAGRRRTNPLPPTADPCGYRRGSINDRLRRPTLALSGHRPKVGRERDNVVASGRFEPAGFDFTLHMRRLCEDMVARLEELRHIDIGLVAVSFSQARKAADCGMYASLTPLRFAGGRRHTVRRGRRWTMQRVEEGGREMLYVLNFYLPRFLDLPLEEKLTTVVHELWHIGPRFDGDLRRFGGRCYAHSGSQQEYDAHVKRLVDRWLALGPPAPLYDFLRLGFRQLTARHGRVYGRKVPAPKLVRLE